jgi:tetratricopeptide (TPR) repeat protein
MSRAIAFAAVLIAAGLAGSPLALGQFDQIYVAKGTPSRGVVTEMTKDTVTLEIQGVQRPFQVNDIARITFADEPSELANTRNIVNSKNWPLAMQEISKLDGKTFDRPYIAADVAYYKALCQARLAMSEGGDKEAALQALFAWARGNASNWHFYEAAEVMGDLAMASGKFEDAARYFGPIANAPWGDYKMRANIGAGRALASQKKYEEALQKFDAALVIDLSTPEAASQKLLATVGKATCLCETGKPDEAVAILQDIILKNDPQDAVLFARTYNALGNCYLKQGKTKDALQAFLHTDILFSTDEEAHAEALYRLSKLWNEVNKSNHATEARAILREKYAGSLWSTLE